MSRCLRAISIGLFWSLPASASDVGAAQPPRVTRHVLVYREPGRFAGWPANHGMWSWGDEILVGFSRGYYKDRGQFHHINKEKPEEFLLARSQDGGANLVGRSPPSRGDFGGDAGNAPRHHAAGCRARRAH